MKNELERVKSKVRETIQTRREAGIKVQGDLASELELWLAKEKLKCRQIVSDLEGRGSLELGDCLHVVTERG